MIDFVNQSTFLTILGLGGGSATMAWDVLGRTVAQPNLGPATPLLVYGAIILAVLAIASICQVLVNLTTRTSVTA